MKSERYEVQSPLLMFPSMPRSRLSPCPGRGRDKAEMGDTVGDKIEMGDKAGT